MSKNVQIDATAEPLWNDKQLANFFNIGERTPAQWRYLGKFKEELPWFKIGRSVRCRPSDARALMAKK